MSVLEPLEDHMLLGPGISLVQSLWSCAGRCVVLTSLHISKKNTLHGLYLYTFLRIFGLLRADHTQRLNGWFEVLIGNKIRQNSFRNPN
jgi:hypothetical protein